MSHPFTKLGWDATVIAGTPKTVRLATAAALPAYTQAGAGVGATLTADAVGVLTVDGAAVALNDRIILLDAHAASAADAGIYLCTTAGAGGAAFVLTRATDFDAAAAGEIELGASARPTAGTANVGKTYMLATTGAITVDTTELEFTEYAVGAFPESVTSTPLHTPAIVTGMSAILSFVEGTALSGGLTIEVVNATDAEIKREQEGLETLPWQTIADIEDASGDFTITDGSIAVSGDAEAPIYLPDVLFGWLRFKWTGTIGVGTVTARVQTK